MESISWRKKKNFLSSNKKLYLISKWQHTGNMHASKFTLNFKINIRHAKHILVHVRLRHFYCINSNHDKSLNGNAQINDISRKVLHWCISCAGIPISCYLISCMWSQRILTALFQLALECTAKEEIQINWALTRVQDVSEAKCLNVWLNNMTQPFWVLKLPLSIWMFSQTL